MIDRVASVFAESEELRGGTVSCFVLPLEYHSLKKGGVTRVLCGVVPIFLQ